MTEKVGNTTRVKFEGKDVDIVDVDGDCFIDLSNLGIEKPRAVKDLCERATAIHRELMRVKKHQRLKVFNAGALYFTLNEQGLVSGERLSVYLDDIRELAQQHQSIVDEINASCKVEATVKINNIDVRVGPDGSINFLPSNHFFSIGLLKKILVEGDNVFDEFKRGL